MTILPTPHNPTSLAPHYDVVVLGSGLGAAILAARAAAVGCKVALFERQSTLGHEPAQAAWPFAHEPSVFEHKALPTKLRADVTGLAAGLARASRFAKAGANNEQALTGVYLADAVARGAQAFVGFVSQTLQPHARGFKLTFQIEGVGRERYDAPALYVTATDVVVAEGSASGAWLKSTGMNASGGVSCLMADTGAAGVTDDQGRVFLGTGIDVHAHLLVAGRALCAPELGVCPTLTMAGIAERQAALWLASLGKPIHEEDGPLPAPAPPVAAGLRFTEAMTGYVSDQAKAAGTYDAGFRLGKQHGSPLVFVLTLATDNVDAMGRDPQHPARSVGTVVAPALDPNPLLVAGGDFNLFVDQADGSRRMKYRMQLLADSGRVFFFDGFKVIRDDPGVDVWPDTTTLYITVYDGPNDAAPVWGHGILHILPKDFASQLLTFQVTNARNKWQQVRAQTGFYRLFLGTLFETYAGMAAFLPDVRKPGGVFKMMAAKLGWFVLFIVAVMLWIWPWRPSILRNQPFLSPGRALAGNAVAGDVEKLQLFPQLLTGLRAATGEATVTQETYHCSWVPDNIVQTHGALGHIPFHPKDISVLSELAIKRGFVNLTRIRDGAGRVIGIGSQVETVILTKGAVTRTAIDAFTDWSLTFPGRGTLFLGQVEGGPDLAELQNEVAKTGQAWRGQREINHTLGPLSGSRGIIHGGTGAFADVVGAFREFNILKEVPPHTDIVADSRYELALVHAKATDVSGPPQAQQLGLPPRCRRRLNRELAWRLVKRTFVVNMNHDVVYSTGGSRTGVAPYPRSLGPLTDPALADVRVFLGKLRDEHGEVTGMAGASMAPDDKAQPGAQWTLTIAGAGTLHVVPDEAGAALPQQEGYFGKRRGLIVDGTGQFANATGVLHEAWPSGTTGQLVFDLTLVMN